MTVRTKNILKFIIIIFILGILGFTTYFMFNIGSAKFAGRMLHEENNCFVFITEGNVFDNELYKERLGMDRFQINLDDSVMRSLFGKTVEIQGKTYENDDILSPCKWNGYIDVSSYKSLKK